jgi:peptidyl-prolyl cis-trans isomerase D
MSLEVFRRNQRTLLAIFAILAMFGFVVSDSLPRLLSGSSTSGRDQQVVKLYDRWVYQSDLNQMARERSIANQFFSRLAYVATPFGGQKTRELVDALILQHEADRLGIPAGPQEGKEYLKRITRGLMNGETFHRYMGDLANQVSEDQVLSAIANQIRLNYVRGEVYSLPGMLTGGKRLIGSPMFTPYDVFRAYRDQSEKVSAKLVEVPVSKFLPQVAEPSAEELQSYYDRYKDVMPDPSRPTPGFKVPRQVQVEVLSIDGNALARSLKDRISEAELKTAYENRKSDFEVQPGPGDLPNDLFAGHPELTPPVIRPFADVRSILASSLAEEKAQAEIVERFEKVKKDVLDPFLDSYQDALDKQEEAKKPGSRPVPLPSPSDLKDVALREGMVYEMTPMLSREDAERHGTISGAKVGMTWGAGGRSFGDEFFDAKRALYESVELVDTLRTHYLARKVQDAPPRVPPLDEVRSQVSLAWKTETARPLAQKAAEQLADQLKKQGTPPKDATFQGHPVVTIPAIARLQSPMNLSMNPVKMDQPEETPISEVPFPGEAFRTAYFSLQPGSVAVAPNQPKTSYYAMILERREPATFAALYAPVGEVMRYNSIARDQADRQLVDNWMNWLRLKAGLDPNWVPPDEAKEKDAASSKG